jgi:hypothetical protein
MSTLEYFSASKPMMNARAVEVLSSEYSPQNQATLMLENLSALNARNTLSGSAKLN